uniref:Uncharacterized protein n=1 Tax=Globodera rostochiensis TaxID=31243 RepID=A0A914IAF2_GLORO
MEILQLLYAESSAAAAGDEAFSHFLTFVHNEKMREHSACNHLMNVLGKMPSDGPENGGRLLVEENEWVKGVPGRSMFISIPMRSRRSLRSLVKALALVYRRSRLAASNLKNRLKCMDKKDGFAMTPLSRVLAALIALLLLIDVILIWVKCKKK